VLIDFYRYLFYRTIKFIEENPFLLRKTYSNSSKAQIILGFLYFLILLAISEYKYFRFLNNGTYSILILLFIVILNINVFEEVKSSVFFEEKYSSFSKTKKLIYSICFYILWIVAIGLNIRMFLQFL